MPEVIRLSDRILVMRNHAIVGELSNTHQYEEMSEAIMARLS
jgi:ABC-type sugar transport system ATPase subunit